jgi:hypothetical protein
MVARGISVKAIVERFLYFNRKTKRSAFGRRETQMKQKSKSAGWPTFTFLERWEPRGRMSQLFFCGHDYAGPVSNHPRRYRDEWCEVKMKTPASAA